MTNGSPVEGAVSSVLLLTMKLGNRHGDWARRRVTDRVDPGELTGRLACAEITSCERVFDEPSDGVWASDHFGVTADLAVPEGP